MLVVAVFNPARAVYLFLSRFLGGTFITLITFYQHGLVDPDDPHEVHGHTIDFVAPSTAILASTTTSSTIRNPRATGAITTRSTRVSPTKTAGIRP